MRSWFSSEREKRLWIALAVVLLAIYATMEGAAAIVASLGEEALNRAGDNLVLALIITLVVIPIFFIRKGMAREEIAVGLGVGAVYALMLLRLGSLEARSHLFEYSMVAGLLHEALLERRGNGRLAWPPSLLALLLAAGLGCLDEAVQSLLPSRVFDLVDIAFNSLAAVIIIGARASLGWARRRRACA